jgi:hypothetical protein
VLNAKYKACNYENLIGTDKLIDENTGNVFKRTFIYATLTRYMLLTEMNFTFSNSFF